MSSLTGPNEIEPAAAIETGGNLDQIGIVTRAVSWMIDAVVINLVAIIVGVGTTLVLSIFPLGKSLKPAFEVVAGSVYVLWTASYFVVLWSLTAQTVGARVMQIRLVTASQGRVKPGRAILRWVGMNLAMIPLFAGFLPIPFGRRALPDWLAHTLVLDAPRPSVSEVGRAEVMAAVDARRNALAG